MFQEDMELLIVKHDCKDHNVQQFMIGNRIIPADEYWEAMKDCTEWTFGDWPAGEGIGSSDVSCVIHDIFDRLKVDKDAAVLEEWNRTRKHVNLYMGYVLARREDKTWE